VEVADYPLSDRIELFWLEDVDNDLKPRKTVSGLTASDHLASMATAVKRRAETHFPSKGFTKA
jgi:predicted alpha/beta-hydrolase family hydrolase